jgi:hypothetical protein
MASAHTSFVALLSTSRKKYLKLAISLQVSKKLQSIDNLETQYEALKPQQYQGQSRLHVSRVISF